MEIFEKWQHRVKADPLDFNRLQRDRGKKREKEGFLINMMVGKKARRLHKEIRVGC